jgi:hypothetical protein
VSIDPIDEHAFCGTRSGDILEISLSKGIYSRSGPIDKKIKGSIHQVVSKFKNLYCGTSEGSFVKIDKKTMQISGEVSFNDNSQITVLAASEGKVYSVSDRSVVRSVYDNTSIQ